MRFRSFKKAVYIPLFLVILYLFTSCSQQGMDRNKCGPCPLYLQIEPNLSFRVVDKATGQDLFFSSPAPYTVAQLKIRHLENGKPDTVFLRIDSLDHYFNILIPTIHNVDTVTMQIATKPQDTLLFETAIVGKCCPRLVLNSVLYDGTVVYTSSNNANVAVLSK
ncbi:MAG TPA: hypothetical protein VIM16_02540 [Mucilaginibacter sp.]|jgi:hypothetical protein